MFWILIIVLAAIVGMLTGFIAIQKENRFSAIVALIVVAVISVTGVYVDVQITQRVCEAKGETFTVQTEMVYALGDDNYMGMLYDCLEDKQKREEYKKVFKRRAGVI